MLGELVIFMWFCVVRFFLIIGDKFVVFIFFLCINRYIVFWVVFIWGLIGFCGNFGIWFSGCED